MFLRRLCFLVTALMLWACSQAESDGFDAFSSEKIMQSMLSLHDGQYFMWSECGKRLRRKEGTKRAKEYADMIEYSLKDVYSRTGQIVNPDYVVAVLFRESSHNECAIGKQETLRLAKELGRMPKKEDCVGHVKKWSALYSRALTLCRKSNGDRKGRSGCVHREIARQHPEYKHIQGWDLGVGQYRWPGTSALRKRQLVLPDGQLVSGLSIKKMFDYRISIQLVVEDLATYRVRCRSHNHYNVSKRGKKQKVDPEEAYYAHHHTGGGSWSLSYWKRVRRHLKVINANSSSLVSVLKKTFIIQHM